MSRTFLSTLFTAVKGADSNRDVQRNSRRLTRRIRGGERLEERALFAGLPYNWPVTDMTQLASMFSAHEGPTNLYLNFDGNSDSYVSFFESTTGDRNRDIHEILFRTAEIFAPFNVQVRRIYGNGNTAATGGHTTIFIGDKLSNTDWYEGDVWNDDRAYAQADYPSPGRGVNHIPNSDEYNVGFVDPISYVQMSGGPVQNYSSWSNVQIARVVAHEAGHTFGLAHVLSGGANELMSYDAPSRTMFADQTYSTTSLNYNGETTEPDPALQPMWRPWGSPYVYPIVTQNSFTYLQAALGPRSTDFANVADSDATKPGFFSGWQNNLSLGSSIAGAMNQYGDFDVFDFTAGSTQWVQIDAAETGGDDFDTVLYVLNGQGNMVLHFDDDGGAYHDSRIVFRAIGGQSYKLVVGSYGGNSLGTYQLTLEQAVFTVNPDIALLGGITVSTRDDGPFSTEQSEELIRFASPTDSLYIEDLQLVAANPAEGENYDITERSLAYEDGADDYFTRLARDPLAWDSGWWQLDMRG